MNWYSINTEERTLSPVTEIRTLKFLSRAVSIAIGRWILSGLDCPDENATDGVSLEEAAMEIDS